MILIYTSVVNSVQGLKILNIPGEPYSDHPGCSLKMVTLQRLRLLEEDRRGGYLRVDTLPNSGGQVPATPLKATAGTQDSHRSTSLSFLNTAVCLQGYSNHLYGSVINLSLCLGFYDSIAPQTQSRSEYKKVSTN